MQILNKITLKQRLTRLEDILLTLIQLNRVISIEVDKILSRIAGLESLVFNKKGQETTGKQQGERSSTPTKGEKS